MFSGFPGETGFSSRKDGHLVFLDTYIFINICPFLVITGVSVGHIKMYIANVLKPEDNY